MRWGLSHSAAFSGVHIDLRLLCTCVLALQVVHPSMPLLVSRATDQRMRGALWPEPAEGLGGGRKDDLIDSVCLLNLNQLSF